MKNDKIIEAWNKIEPDSAAQKKMLNNILERAHSDETKERKIFGMNYWKFVASIAACFILFTSVAVAQYLGGFDRLRAIIGEERATLAQPLELSNMPIGEFVVEDDIRVELVAIEVFDNILNLYITLEDLAANRLDEGVYIRHQLISYDECDLIGHRACSFSRHGSQEVIDHNPETGIITIRIWYDFGRYVSWEGRKLNLVIQDVFYNHTFFYGPIDLVADLGSIEHNPSTKLFTIKDKVDDFHFPFSANFGFLAEHRFYDEKQAGLRFSILVPHLSDIDFGIEGVITTISSIGIIDGRLHVQTYDYDPERTDRGYSFITLRCPGGYNVNTVMQTRFSISESGEFHYSRTNDPRYEEYIWEVDIARLSEYQLYAHLLAYDATNFSWSTFFEVAKVENHLVLDGLNLDIGDHNIKEIRLSPLSLRLTFEDNRSSSWPPEIRINTENGAITTSPMSWGINDAAYTIDSDFLDLDTVISIEIAGEIIELR